MKSKSTRVAVAAIDFGTAFSGYAYALKKGWHESVISRTDSTSMLLNPDKTFRAFGYEAEKIYSSLVEINWNDDGENITKKNINDYYFFQRFTVLQVSNVFNIRI